MQADKVLLVDTGNTCIKYRWLSDTSEQVQVADTIDVLVNRLSKAPVLKIYLSNVGNDDAETQLQLFCQSNNIALQVITTPHSAFGITNSYANPNKMGVDRWLAMVGAAGKTELPFAVIDAGTAITVDFVAGGQHLGGWILPGYHTMKNALVGATKRVTQDKQVPTRLDAGTDTEECVAMGCLAAVQGAVFAANRYLAERFDDYLVICTGGDKNLLTSVQGSVNLSAANLVIDGLARYAEKASFD
ncbi:MAG: type III pantothenate kinase [Pseudomonadota bacterium]|uniref:Type III pantothenate kinase n=1 Tax=Marisediminitalea aggregata TaxID=634436 RepID=A0A1M5P6A4_9ALTE|nr:type III pantothenate kinase [Marisediminitalea aggregata]MEC8227171.1 type III pantothenate kinase [Pseudomonadota bacterium]SHG97316.1 type III pantothenate kinase [Marisediminitalea aggregata]